MAYVRCDVIAGRDLANVTREEDGSNCDGGSRVVSRGRGCRTLAMRRAALRPVVESMLIERMFFNDCLLLPTPRRSHLELIYASESIQDERASIP